MEVRRLALLAACAILAGCGSPKRDFLDGAPGGPEHAATEVDAARCTEQRGADATLYVHNDFPSDAVGLVWVSPQCVETAYPLIPAGTTVEQPARVGDVWHVQKLDGTLLKAVICDQTAAHVHVP